MPAAFARSCEIKIDALDHGRRSVAGRRARCQKKQKKSDDQRGPVTRYEVLFSDGRTLICSSTIE